MLGYSEEEIGTTLETMMGSRRVTTFVEDGEEYDVVLQARADDRTAPANLENLYVLSGRLRLHLEDDDGVVRTHDLGPGESAHVDVPRIHRFEAVTDVELVEVSTPEIDDVERLEDDFGREGTSAP